jgi:SAM-dependent methyltransferase
MSFFTEVDRWLRHSPLARAQPFIRARMPWLHRALLTSRDLVLPYRSRHGLARYQHRAIERFFAFCPDISGAVLEVGSDVEGAVLKELADRGCRHLIGLNIDVDPSAHLGRGTGKSPAYEMIKGDVRYLPFKHESISAIVSVTAFEHIHEMDVALREMHRVLKPGGIVYSDFGPIWSCSIGHHVFAIVDGVEARHWKPGKNPVPHFAHLLSPPEAVRAAVLEKEWVFPALADEIVRWIYERDGVNRVFYETYVNLFNASPFEIRSLVPVREHVPAAIQKKLEQSCAGYKDFGVRMVEVVLEKPRSAPNRI